MKLFSLLSRALCSTAFATWLPAATPTPALSPAVSTLASPCGPDSGESSLFTAPDGTVYLTWCGPGDAPGERALRFATLPPDATAWSAPRLVVSTPLLMENWADFPTLTVDPRGVITAQWFQSNGPDAHGYAGWSARSTDAGATWSEARPLGHEFVALAAYPDGRVLAVWLESLRVPREQRTPGAPAMVLRSRLLAATGETLREDLVDPDVCTCCQTSLTLLPDDEALVTYRGHTADEIRDNLTARFHPDRGWAPPTLLHSDGWKIAGCPVNGPALDARGPHAAIAWFTMAGGLPRVQAKLSADAGRTWGSALPIDLGRPLGRVDALSLPDGTALISWLETLPDTAAGIHVRRLFPDGRTSAPALVALTTGARATGFPRLTLRTDGHVLLTYTVAVPDEPTHVETVLIDTASFTPAAPDKTALNSAPVAHDLNVPSSAAPATHNH